jgi:hypothetical protein
MSFVKNSLVIAFSALGAAFLFQGCSSESASSGGDDGSILGSGAVDPRMDNAELSRRDAAVDATADAASDASADAASDASADAGGDSCADAGALMYKVPPGGTVTRPPEQVLRITFVYRGSLVAISNLFGANKVLPPSDGPFQPGVNSGYWAELQGATGQTLFSRLFQDPTHIEVPPPPDGGPFGQVLIPECDAKYFFLDLPNNPQAKRIVIFGNGYSGAGVAQELGHFTLP